MLTEEKNCLSCNKPLKKEMRKDAKFCNEYCKTAFNNQKRFGLDPAVMRVDKILHKNFDILSKALKNQKYVEISRLTLEKRGFKFDFITQRRGAAYGYCYNFMFKEKDAKTILIGIAPDHVIEEQF